MPSQQGGGTLIYLATDDTLMNYIIGVAAAASGTRMIRTGGTDGTLDRVTYMDASGRIYTNRNWTIAGEDPVNGRTDMNMKYRESAQDASALVAVTGTTEGAANTLVDWTDVSHYTAFQVYVGNTSAVALTMVYVYTAPTAADTYKVNLAPYKDTLEIACETLNNTSGIAFRGLSGHGLKYLKVTATVAAGTANCYSWLQKNV